MKLRAINQKLKDKNTEKEFFDISLKELYSDFINTFSNIFRELGSVTIKLSGTDNDFYYLNCTISILRQVMYILFRPERLVSVGIAFIISSFLVFFILVSK